MSRRKKRILLVSDMPWFGGAEHYLELLVKNINHERYELIFACRSDCQWVGRISDYCDRIAKLSIPGPYDYHPQFLQLHMFALHRVPTLVNMFEALSPDLIHINQPGLPNGIVPIVAALRSEIPVISTVHSPHLPSQTTMRTGKVRDLGVLLASRLWRYPKIFVSISSRNRFMTNCPWPDGDHFVVHNGLDLGQYLIADRARKEEAKRKLVGKVDSQVIGFVGRLSIEKGVHKLIDAFTLIARLLENVYLVLYGGKEVAKAIQSRVSVSGLKDRVVLAGWTDDVASAMDAFDIFVFPSMREGLPYAVMEAMAKSLPVVASALDGIPELVIDGETGYLVPPRDAHMLAHAITRLLEDRSLAAKMGVNGRRRIEANFSLAESIAQTCDIYERLMR